MPGRRKGEATMRGRRVAEGDYRTRVVLQRADKALHDAVEEEPSVQAGE